MKNVIFLLLLLPCHLLTAQNVGIGTTTPHASAQLDITSTTKGLLIPRMTTAQRNAIVTPADGLIIFNTTTLEMNQRQNGAWKILLNNDSWTGGGSGQMFNIGDNVGINTAGPGERLDVSGNIRTNSSLIINNAAAILQLQNAGVNKGFMQLSGDNLRLGTNSGNSTGNIVVRFNGNDRITINPAGDMSTEGRINRTGLGTADFLPICYGRIDVNGSVLPGGSGNFFVTKNGVGDYTIFVNGETTPKVAIVTPIYQNCTSSASTIGPNSDISVLIKVVPGNTSYDSPFQFVVFRN